MSVLAFRWHSGTRIEQLRSLVLSRCEEWMRSWAVDPSGVDCIRPDLSADALSGCWHEVRTQRGVMGLRISEEAVGILGCRLVGVHDGAQHQFSEGIAKRALSDLGQTLVGDLAFNSQAGTADGHPFLSDSRHGVLAFELNCKTVQITVFMDAEMCDSLCPPSRPASGHLASRKEAILTNEITLLAVLDLGTAALERTVDLRPGDLLKTSIPLDASIRLVASGSGEPAMKGELVEIEGCRAFRCHQTTNQ